MHHSLNVSAPLYSTLSDPPHGIFDKNIRWFSTVVEHMPRDQEVVDSHLPGAGYFYNYHLSLSHFTLEQVFRGGEKILIFHKR